MKEEDSHTPEKQPNNRFLQLISVTKEKLITEKNLAYFSALPVFFSWLTVITWRYENERLRNVSLYSALGLILFLMGIFLALGTEWIPNVGGYIANFFHTLGIILYLLTSIFLIYLVATEKKIVIPILHKWKDSLDDFLEGTPSHNKQAPIAQLDRASDYGSEG